MNDIRKLQEGLNNFLNENVSSKEMQKELKYTIADSEKTVRKAQNFLLELKDAQKKFEVKMLHLNPSWNSSESDIKKEIDEISGSINRIKDAIAKEKSFLSKLNKVK